MESQQLENWTFGNYQSFVVNIFAVSSKVSRCPESPTKVYTKRTTLACPDNAPTNGFWQQRNEQDYERYLLRAIDFDSSFKIKQAF